MAQGLQEIALPWSLRVLRQLPLPHKLGMLERLYGNALFRLGAAWVKASNGVIWRLDLREPCHRWIVYGDYEGSRQMTWVRRWLEEGGIVIDSGANIGQMLLYYASFPGVKTYAFEPIPTAAHWLERCLAEYPKWQVSISEMALSDKDARTNMKVSGGDAAMSTTRMDWYVGKDLIEIDVATVRLDRFLADRGISGVRLWKLDVEGHEIHALAGAEKYLKKQAIDAILVEVTANRDEIASFLDRFGYSLHVLRKDGHLLTVGERADNNGNCIALSFTRRHRPL